jgi:hypothetical protein
MTNHRRFRIAGGPRRVDVEEDVLESRLRDVRLLLGRVGKLLGQRPERRRQRHLAGIRPDGQSVEVAERGQRRDTGGVDDHSACARCTEHVPQGVSGKMSVEESPDRAELPDGAFGGEHRGAVFHEDGHRVAAPEAGGREQAREAVDHPVQLRERELFGLESQARPVRQPFRLSPDQSPTGRTRTVRVTDGTHEADDQRQLTQVLHQVAERHRAWPKAADPRRGTQATFAGLALSSQRSSRVVCSGGGRSSIMTAET